MNTTREERIEALKKSIRHWEEDWKGLDLEKGGDLPSVGFSGEECALCQLHEEAYREYESENNCGECPLIDRDGYGCGFGNVSPYMRANRAFMLGNKDEFLEAKDDILDRMRAALEEEQ